MGSFNEASSCSKGAMVLAAIALSLNCFATAMPGWAFSAAQCQYLNNCSSKWLAIEALEIIAFILIVTSCVMVLCIVLLDELKGNKIFHAIFVIIIISSGIFAIIGIGLYGSDKTRTENHSIVITVLGAAAAFGSGIFGAFEFL